MKLMYIGTTGVILGGNSVSVIVWLQASPLKLFTDTSLQNSYPK